MSAKTILAVDKNRRNLELLGQFLQRAGYAAAVASSLEEFDAVLDGSTPPALALIDVVGFDRSIWERCQRLHEKGVPLLVISPPQYPSAQQEGLSHGARGVLTKPLIMKELLALIRGLTEE
ncbi:MAG: response regulator [Anaerolineae bacterium]